MLWAIKQHRLYLWGKRVVLITYCYAIAFLFTSQTLSTKRHWWALRYTEYAMDLHLEAGREPPATQCSIQAAHRRRTRGGF